MKQLQGMDAAFVAFEQSHAPLHIGSIAIYDPSTAPGGFVRFKDILEFVRERLHLAPSMRRRMVRTPFNIDYPYWVEDPDFDLEYHIRHVALPKPGDWRQLNILAARNFSRPLDLERPPWEILVVEGLDKIKGVPKGSYAYLSKMHHAAIDGMSGVEMMNALHTLSPKIEKTAARDRWRPERVPSQMGLFARGYARLFTLPVRQAKVAASVAPGLIKAAAGAVKGEFNISEAAATPRTRFNENITPHRIVQGVNLPLADIKRLRKEIIPGATVNDVVLTIVGGAMRAYLDDKDELPEETLAAMAPISVRKESERTDAGNEVAAMRAPLGTHLANAKDRLAFVHGETVKSKAMSNAMGARQMSEMSKASPALFLGLGARAFSAWNLANKIKPVFNTVVTNVPGPPVPLYSNGAKLVGLYGKVCLADGVGLGHVVHSYVDELTITATACREMMPDPEFYETCLETAFDELMAELPGKDG